MKEHKVKRIFVEGAIQPSFIADSIAKHSAMKQIGAHSIFLGQVRNDVIAEKEVMAIEYTAYEEMANEVMALEREKLFARYELTCLHIYHSIGKVKSGEICLFVFTSSKHRDPAIEACKVIVEFIKKELPIWGKEHLVDASVWKKEN